LIVQGQDLIVLAAALARANGQDKLPRPPLEGEDLRQRSKKKAAWDRSEAA